MFVFLNSKPDKEKISAAEEAVLQKAHRANIGRLVEEGKMIVAGPPNQHRYAEPPPDSYRDGGVAIPPEVQPSLTGQGASPAKAPIFYMTVFYPVSVTDE